MIKTMDQKTTSPDDDAVTPEAYVAWKDAKVRAALAEAEDRTCMIPAADVWERFGFER
ncbi:hypothetical protein ACQKGC_03320 [Allorhizobium pseudoryzae]|uniref:hypothetical protein n=1 Tax=Allorhizobium pseudoryzae TaxID=379684 RepID=UPI003D0591A4